MLALARFKVNFNFDCELSRERALVVGGEGQVGAGPFGGARPQRAQRLMRTPN